MFKLLGERLKKAKRAPTGAAALLLASQIDYALDDVRHLEACRTGCRSDSPRWAATAGWTARWQTWQSDVAGHAQPRALVEGVAASSGSRARSLAVVRELWRWREREAERRNCPTRRVLRDDLIVELAKRRSADPRADSRHARHGARRFAAALPQLAAAVERAMALPDDECPKPLAREVPPQTHRASGSSCRRRSAAFAARRQLAPSIVGTASDVRDLVAYHLGMDDSPEPPLLGRGWRTEVVGRLIFDLLEGKLAIRVRDPRSKNRSPSNRSMASKHRRPLNCQRARNASYFGRSMIPRAML